MSNNSSTTSNLLRRKIAGILTVAFAGAMAVGVSGAVAATVPHPSVELKTPAAQIAPKKLDRKWVWKKSAVNFDGMYRASR